MECPECRQEFDEVSRIPRILTACGHTICECCLKSRYKKKSILCPQCSVATVAQNLGILPSNMALIQLKQTKSMQDMCSKHNKPIEDYCCNDKVLVCVICLLEDGHKTHELSTIPKTAKKYRDLIINYRQLATTTQEVINKESRELNEKQNSLLHNYNHLLKDFSIIFDVIRKILMEKELSIRDRLKKIIDDEIEMIKSKQNQLLKQLESIEQFKIETISADKDSDINFIINYPKREVLAKSVTSKVQPTSKTDPFTAISIETEISTIIKLIQNKFFPKSTPKSATQRKKPTKDPPPNKLTTKLSNKTIPKPLPTLDWQNISAISRAHSDEDTLSMKSFDFQSLYKLHSTKIYTISGFSDKALPGVECYDSHLDICADLRDCLQPRTQFSALSYQGDILILGGKQGGKRISTCEQYSLPSNSWTLSEISLPFARSGFASLGISNDIYLLGGSEGSVLKNFEMLSMGQWVSLPGMNAKRDELSAVVGPDLNIYAIGGYGGDSVVLNSAEVYRMEDGAWENVPGMGRPRRALSAVGLPDGIYAVGGYDGSTYLRDLERYDYRMNRWEKLEPMKHGRCTLSCVASRDCNYIYAIGGFNGDAMGVVERYSIVENRWEEVVGLNTPRFMHCSVAITD